MEKPLSFPLFLISVRINYSETFIFRHWSTLFVLAYDVSESLQNLWYTCISSISLSQSNGTVPRCASPGVQMAAGLISSPGGTYIINTMTSRTSLAQEPHYEKTGSPICGEVETYSISSYQSSHRY